MSEFCNFGDALEAMIRDHIVSGINDDAIQKHLLAELTLTYSRAVELAQSLERADKNVKELKFKTRGGESSSAPAPSQEVHRVVEQCPCFCCGKAGHLASRCRVDRDEFATNARSKDTFLKHVVFNPARGQQRLLRKGFRHPRVDRDLFIKLKRKVRKKIYYICLQ